MSDTDRTYKPVTTAAAWRGPDLQHDRSWLTTATAENVRDIEVALAHVRARGLTPESMRRVDFPLPSMADELAGIADDIEAGCGFALIRGLPVARWGVDDASVAFWGLSLHLGRPVSQNRRGDLMMAVRDTGLAAETVDARGPLTNSQLHYHSDFSDIVGLLCINPAREGGTSRICSALAIYNQLVTDGRTDLIDALYDGYLFDRKGEEGPDVAPVSDTPIPMLSWHRGILSFRYTPGWSGTAVQKTGRPWTSQQQAAVDEVNRLSNDPGFYLDMNFQPGDVQFLNNYAVLHSRTAFVDFPEPARKRILQRIWLRADRGRTLAADFDHLFGAASTRDGIPPVHG